MSEIINENKERLSTRNLVEVNWGVFDRDSHAILYDFTIQFNPFDFRNYKWFLISESETELPNDTSNFIESTLKNYIGVGVFKDGEEVTENTNWSISSPAIRNSELIWCEDLRDIVNAYMIPDETWWTENDLGRRLNFKYGLNSNLFFNTDSSSDFNLMMKSINDYGEESGYYDSNLMYNLSTPNQKLTIRIQLEIDVDTNIETPEFYQLRVSNLADNTIYISPTAVMLPEGWSEDETLFELLPHTFYSNSKTLEVDMPNLNNLYFKKGSNNNYSTEDGQLRFRVKKITTTF